MCPPVPAPGQTTSAMIEARSVIPAGSTPEARPARTRPSPEPRAQIETAGRAHAGRPRTDRPPLAGRLPTNCQDHAANAAPRPVPARSIPLIFRHLHHTPPVAVGRFYGKRPEGFTVESRAHDSGRPARSGPKSTRSAQARRATDTRGTHSSGPVRQGETAIPPNAARCDPKRPPALAAEAVAPAPTRTREGRKPATS